MDLLDPSGQQIHDFNPGVPKPPDPSAGLFWTAPIRMSSVAIDLGEATASLHLKDFLTKDFFNNKNNWITTRPPVDAVVSYTIRWGGVNARIDVVDFEDTGLTTNHRFAGRFIEDTATVEWSVSVPSMGFTFSSDPAATSKSVFAEIGRERNGVFFREGEGD
jgi:hypothetical protein